MESILKVEKVKVYYHKVLVLKGISLLAPDGGIVTLIGTNGAGKTTLMRTISGLKDLTSGQILFQGERIDILSPHEIVRRGVAHVPEGRRIFPRMTVYENLLMGSYGRKDSQKVAKDLNKVYSHFSVLLARKSQVGGSLSGGEQQMLAIGRALMAAPRLLLLDEPSMGLAPLMVKEITKIILQIRKEERVGLILVEQNARLALKISETGYVLENGSIVLEGPASQLLQEDHIRRAYLGA